MFVFGSSGGTFGQVVYSVRLLDRLGWVVVGGIMLSGQREVTII